MFPPDDPELKGISSVKLLREAYAQVRRAGYELVNADVVFIGQEPRLAPLRQQMQAALAAALDLSDARRISVRATTTDGLGFTGRGEGLAAQAVALLERAT
jgi:2-C-methyl-D-erythritol 2,4-cyclodiphosphate synthase